MVPREDACEAEQVKARRRYQSGEAGEQVERVQYDRGGAIGPPALEGVPQAAIGAQRQPFVRERPAGKITTKTFESSAVTTVERNGGMKIEAFELDAKRLRTKRG